MPYTPILATLGYVFSEDRARVLLVHRNARPSDPHFGKFNGLGGKLNRDEDIVSGMCREIREEAGIECSTLELAGTISWPGFGKNGEDWFGFLFRVFSFTGIPHTRNAEGDLGWHALENVAALPMWPGDRYFLPAVFNFPACPFHAVMPYDAGNPTGWSSRSLPD